MSNKWNNAHPAEILGVYAGDFKNVAVDANGYLIVSGASGDTAAVTLADPVVSTVSVDNAGNDLIVAADPTRRVLGIFNNSSSVTLYIGPTGVTNADGFPIPPQSGIEWGVEDNAAAKAWYGYAASTVDARVLQQVGV